MLSWGEWRVGKNQTNKIRKNIWSLVSLSSKIINSLDQWIFLKKTTRNNTIHTAQRNECKLFIISLMTKSLFRVSTCNLVPNTNHCSNVNENKEFVDKGRIITSTINFTHRWPWVNVIEPIDFQSNKQPHDELGIVVWIVSTASRTWRSR